MLVALSLLALGMLLGFQFKVFVLIPTGALFAMLYMVWCISTAEPMGETFVLLLANLAMLNLGYLVGHLVRSRRNDGRSDNELLSSLL